MNFSKARCGESGPSGNHGLANAVYFDNVMVSHLDQMESPEAPAVIADFLLRFQPVQWVLVTAVNGPSLAMSLRTSAPKGSAADVMRKLLRSLGNGGGHQTKAGGSISMESGSPAEVEKLRKTLKRRLLRALGIKMSRGQKLVPDIPRTKQ